MDAYLQRQDLPMFLKPAGSSILYANVDLSNKDNYQQENYKYHQYYENLSNNISSSVSRSTFFPDDNFPYYQAHKVYRPIEQKNREPSYSSASQVFQEFDSFVDFPTLFSDSPLKGGAYQTAVDMKDGIYLYHGLEVLDSKEYKNMLAKVTNNFKIPPENIKMICNYDMPLPIDKEKIESMGLQTSRMVRKYFPDSKSFKVVAEMAEETIEEDCVGENENVVTPGDFQHEFQTAAEMHEAERVWHPHGTTDHKINTDALKATLSRKSKTVSNSSSVLNALPKPLICSAGVRVSEKYFLTYGGLEIQTSIKHPDPMHCVITKKLVPNDQFWIFNTFTCQFREVRLSVHPTYSSIFPNSIPRFGHSMICSMHERSKGSFNGNPSSAPRNTSSTTNDGKKKTFSELAIIYVMGGYQLGDCCTSFVAMNDLWKCDFFLDNQDTSDEAIASPIGDFTLVNGINSYIINKKGELLENQPDNLKFKGVLNHTMENILWPRPRGFFPLALIDEDELSEFIQWRKRPDDSVISEDGGPIESTTIHSPIPIFKPKLNLFNFSLSSVPTRQSSEKETMVKTISRSSNNTQSSSSSTDQATSFTPMSDTTNSSPSGSIKKKVLIVVGGSTTLYTKYIEGQNQHVFYSHEILNDIWIFDFKTEKWHELSSLAEIEPKLSICGHSLYMKNTSIKIIGGIEKSHYPPEMFEPIHADVSDPCCDDHDEAKHCVAKFIGDIQLNHAHPKKVFADGFELGDTIVSDYKSYFLYDLDLFTFKWKTVKLAIVRNLEYFSPWEYTRGAKILPGIVITKSAALNNAEVESNFNEEFEIASRKRLINQFLLITNAPIFFKDNKLIVFNPDVKMLDFKTNKYIVGSQGLIGNSITEVFSSYF